MKAALAAGQKCATEGCNRMAWNDDFCPRCEDEIRALEAMAEGDAMRLARAMNAAELRKYLARKQRAESFRRAGRFVAKWLWVPNLIAIAGVLLYLGWVWGAAFVSWMVD
jgi:hypothetical protein